jgi:hypothetical protein
MSLNNDKMIFLELNDGWKVFLGIISFKAVSRDFIYFLLVKDTEIRFFGVKHCLSEIFYALTISKWDISITDNWKNVSYHISSLVSNFFILNREFWPNQYEISWYRYFSNDFWYWDFEIQDCLLFQSMPAIQSNLSEPPSSDFSTSNQTMDKLQLTGQTLGRVFNSRSASIHTMH